MTTGFVTHDRVEAVTMNLGEGIGDRPRRVEQRRGGYPVRMRNRLVLLLACLSAALAATVPATQAATTRSCGSVKDPYPGTRYAGVDLSHITAKGVSCTTAKRVARGAHYKALGLTPSPSGIRSFSWNGWKVSGDLRGSHDSYVATKGALRVRWRF